MKRVVKEVSGLFLLMMGFLAGFCQKQINQDLGQSGPAFDLILNFKAVVDATPLEYAKTYLNCFQEPYSINTFKYYISGVELINTDSNKAYRIASDNYFLVDESDASTAIIAVKATASRYNSISFTIGVDSIRNVSGAQSGALDPANGMFWTWNSGYIMAKLEGTSPLSNQVNNRIQYHIGGFKEANSVLRKIVLPFPENTSIDFAPNSRTTLTITANVNSWFNNPNDLHIAQVPVCMTPGELSQKIATNYSKMFSLVNVVNN